MLSNNLIYDVLSEALKTGGSFSEIFVEYKKRYTINIINGVVEKVLQGTDYGVGIRIFNGLKCIYAYTNDTTRDNLLKVAKNAAAAIDNTAISKVLNFNNLEIENKHKIITSPFDYDKKKIVDFLKRGNDASYKYSDKITESSSFFTCTKQNVLIANSEGLFAEDERNYIRFNMSAIASKQDEKQTGAKSPGAMMGIEFLDKHDPVILGNKVAEMAVTNLEATLCPSGMMPVVIDNGFGGVIFHEACGHSLEATSVAKGASEFTGKIGLQIASPLVTAIDDGTLVNEWGSLNIDDEGTKTKRNVLIENGILKSFLVDKLNGLKMNATSTGSSRRESYKFAPTSRMNNTFIDNGNSTKDNIISSIDYGLYAKTMGGGSVSPATGDFNFSVLEGYIIENGKIKNKVKGATLIGKGSDVLNKIEMVSDNLDYSQGMCGSESGSVPTNVGQPMIKISEMTVGGRS